jgi:hypothetical protein
MPCSGDHTEICGGPNALNVYQASDSCLATRAGGYGLIQNGGFESGFASWSAAINSGAFSLGIDTTHEYEGCQAA